MPIQVCLVGPVVAVAGKLDLPAFHSFEQERGVAGFVEAVGGDEHPVIAVERPQAGIDRPMGVLREREAILWVVVAAVGELVDVGGVHDAAGVDGDAPVASQGAGVVVRGHDGEAETRLASAFVRFLVELGVGLDDIVGRNRWTDQVVERGAFAGFGEVQSNQDAAELFAEPGVVEAGEEVGIESGDDGAAAFGGGLPGIVKRRPAAIVVKMEERQANVGALRMAAGDGGPKGEEAEGEFASKRHYRLCEFAFFGEPGNDEQQEWFVRGDPARTINLELRSDF